MRPEGVRIDLELASHGSPAAVIELRLDAEVAVVRAGRAFTFPDHDEIALRVQAHCGFGLIFGCEGVDLERVSLGCACIVKSLRLDAPEIGVDTV